MNKPASNPSDLARETLRTLALRKIPPTPDSYAKIYAEVSGINTEENNGAEKVLRSFASRLEQTPKLAQPGIALKKAIETESWTQCIKEFEKILPSQEEHTQHWPNLIRDLLHQLETTHKGLTIARKKEGLETVLSRFGAHQDILFEKLSGLVRSWSTSSVTPGAIEIGAAPPDTSITDNTATPPAATTETPTTLHPASTAEMISALAELLAQALENLLSTQPELAQDVQALARQARSIKTPEQITALSRQLRSFWIKTELHGSDKTKVHEGLIRLLRLLVGNIGEMIEDEEWLHGQIAILQEIIAKPLDRRSIADAEHNLRDAVIKQSLLKQSMSEAKATLKGLMTSFIGRLGEITTSTGDYHQKIVGYSQKISETNNLAELSHLLDNIMQDTRIIQASALRSHEELVSTRQQVQEAEEKIRKLEQELAEVSELVHQDQLTGALNRRGLDEAFEREATRSDRSKSPICVALLDIDNFKRLNDNLGHQAGDQALKHLSSVIQDALRPSDSVARYGGEEFIIILPDTDIETAAETIERLQRELTKKFFLHENDRVLITFSAGVAQRAPLEPQEDVVGRADKAMYQAKKTGKNRVVIAR